MNEQNNSVWQSEQQPTPAEKKPLPFYKKRWFLPVVIAAAILIVIIIASGSDPVQDDLIDYINNDLSQIEPLETEVLELYEEAKGSSSDYAMYVMLRDEVLPKAKEWQKAAEGVVAETDEVKALHEVYIGIVNDNYNAFVIMLAALENQDFSAVASANEKLDEAKAGAREFKSQLESLMKEHDVEYQ